MSILRSTLTAAAAALLLVPVLATSASAAPALNDTAAAATVVTALPSSFSQDTTGATTDALDASLNAGCGAPFTNASVWFSYTDPDGGGVLADMSASSYSGGFIVTFAQRQFVASRATINEVISLPASNRIVSGATDQVVSLSQTPNRVISGFA